MLAITSDILPIDSLAAHAYSEIFAQLRRNGRPIPTNDIWIAAIAKANHLVLVTNDEHFKYIDGLTIENWLE